MIATLPDVLETERLRCERFRAEHAEELGILDRDPVVNATIFGHTYPPEKTRLRVQWRMEYWAQHGHGDYVVRTRDGGAFVGCAGTFPATRPGAIAVGYALRPAMWGRGYATELCRAVTGALAAVHDGEIVAVVADTNVASRRVLEKSGFVLAGRNEDDTSHETVLYRYLRPGAFASPGGSAAPC